MWRKALEATPPGEVITSKIIQSIVDQNSSTNSAGNVNKGICLRTNRLEVVSFLRLMESKLEQGDFERAMELIRQYLAAIDQYGAAAANGTPHPLAGRQA